VTVEQRGGTVAQIPDERHGEQGKNGYERDLVFENRCMEISFFLGQNLVPTAKETGEGVPVVV